MTIVDYHVPLHVTRARRRRRRRFAVVLCGGALAIIGLLIGGTQWT